MLMYNMHNAETSEREIMAKSWKITTMPLQWINDKSTKHACAGLLGYAFHFEGLPSKISNEKSCTHSKCRINFTKLGTCVHCYFRWWCQQLSDNQNIRTAKISKQHTWFWLHFTYGTFRMMCAVHSRYSSHTQSEFVYCVHRRFSGYEITLAIRWCIWNFH